jgi:chromosome segregation ATPase
MRCISRFNASFCSSAARAIPGGSDSEAKHIRCRLVDEQRGDVFQLAVVVLQIICPRDYNISHSSIKHSLPLTQAVDQQLMAARAVSPALESLLRSCLSPNVHARVSAEQFLRSLRALTQAPPYSNAKVWMRMGTDAAALMAEVSEKVDHNLAAELATLRAEKAALQKELEMSQHSIQATVKEEIRLAQEFLEQRNDELRIETRKRQQYQTSYFTAKAEKEICEQERDKVSKELQCAQETISKLLQRDKRSRTLLEETRSKLVEQHSQEQAALASQLQQAASEIPALQQRVQLLLEKNHHLEERLLNLSDDCAELRQKNERQQEELLRFQETTAADSAASGKIKDVLSATQHELAASRAEVAGLKLDMDQLRCLVQVSQLFLCFICIQK